MCNNKVHIVFVLCKLLPGQRHILFGGQALEGEILIQQLHIQVGIVPAAEGKNFLAAQAEDIAAAELDQLAGDHPSHSSAVLSRLDLGQKPVVFVSALHKENVEFELSQPIQQLLFPPASVPEKTEIAADQEIVPLAQLFHLRGLEAHKISMEITGYKEHGCSILSFRRACLRKISWMNHFSFPAASGILYI